MTTNGTYLDLAMLAGLFQNRLDRLWVSFDGADESRFESIRKGATFQSIVENVRNSHRMNRRHRHKIDVGIAFVVMRKNIDDLKDMDELARLWAPTRSWSATCFPTAKKWKRRCSAI